VSAPWLAGFDECARPRVDGWTTSEVVVPTGREQRGRRAYEVVIRGRGFPTGAQPVRAWVGEVPVEFVRVSADGRTIEGIVSRKVGKRSKVRLLLGDLEV
jgi:hypothetical protein